MDNLPGETDITLEHSTKAEQEIQENLNHYYHDRDQITLRLAELDEEWDIERLLQAHGAALTLSGVIFGLIADKKWFALPIAASVVLLAGIFQRRSYSYPLLHKLGLRTREEINKEKYALKAIRGDFKYLLDVPNSVWSAVNK